MLKNKRKWEKNYFVIILLIFSMTLVFVVSILGITKNHSIGVWGDEFGYWQGAAFFAKKDWSSVASTNNYYGYGLGILLFPIMLLFDFDSVLMFQVALILESLLLSSCILPAYMMMGKLDLCKEKITRIVVSIVAVLYPSNIMFTRTTMSEIALICINWWIGYLIIRFCEEKKISQAIILIIMAVYAYTVHQRALAILLSVLFVIILIYQKSIFTKKNILMLICLLVTVLATVIIKNIYINTMYESSPSYLLATNNMAGQKHKIIKVLTTWTGLVSFILSLIGKIYYIAVASYLFAFYGIFKCILKITVIIKKEKMQSKILPYAYFFLTCLLALGIGALFMFEGYEGRRDVLIYGRYTEYVIGPLILVGVGSILQDYKNMFKHMLTCIVVMTLFTIVVSKYIPINPVDKGNMWINCAGIADLTYGKNFEMNEAVIIAFMRAVLCSTILMVLLNIKNILGKIGVHILLLFVVGMWVYTVVYTWNVAVVDWKEQLYFYQSEAIDKVEKNDKEEIYIYDCNLGGMFQFLRPNAKVIIISSIKELGDSYKTKYVVTSTNSESIIDIKNNYKILTENDRYILWLYSN